MGSPFYFSRDTRRIIEEKRSSALRVFYLFLSFNLQVDSLEIPNKKTTILTVDILAVDGTPFNLSAVDSKPYVRMTYECTLNLTQQFV